VPERIEDVCTSSLCALIIYDMQVGIVSQIAEGAAIVSRRKELLDAARDMGFRIFFTRHFFLPSHLAGVGQLHRSMVWQHQTNPSKIEPLITQGSPAGQIVPELAPREDEVVIDKITMSVFESTFLNIAMRDARLEAFVIGGIALEVGIEATVRHGLDLNCLPIVVSDACGSRTGKLKRRSIATLTDTGEVRIFDAAKVVSAMHE
jgi:biuret amidohydrolase